MAHVRMQTSRVVEESAEKAAEKLVSSLEGAKAPALVTVFLDPERDQVALYRAVRERLPKSTRLVGASSAMPLDNAGFHRQPEAVVMAALSGDLEVGVGFATGLSTDAAGAGAKAVVKALGELGVKGEDVDPTKYVGVVIDDGFRMKKEEMLVGMLSESPGLSLVGGGAGSKKPGGVFGSVNVDGETMTDATMIIVVKTAAPWAALRHHAYRPTGEKVVLTRIDESCTRAIEINGKPAAKAYADMLGVEIGELDFGKPRGFSYKPTALRVGREYFMRAPWQALPDGSILFANMLREGTELELMELGDMASMLSSFFKEELPQRVKSPSAMLMFNCGARQWVAAGCNAVEAVDKAFGAAPTLAGMDCIFELYNGFQINSTLTMLAFGSSDG